MQVPNVRIVCRVRDNGTPIKTEVLGSWFVRPDEWPNSAKAQYIMRELADAQADEPDIGWTLETRGTDVSWHAAQV